MTFKTWIKKYKGKNNPIGDLANDVIADKSFPNSVSYKNILAYLENLGACDGAINAFNDAWELYKDEK